MQSRLCASGHGTALLALGTQTSSDFPLLLWFQMHEALFKA